MSLKVSEGLLEQSLTIMRECGAGGSECVVIWVAKAADPECARRVVHPKHDADWGGYRVDGDWLNRLWDELADNDERIVAQVHTHPRRACHSKRDDRYPILLTSGLYSLVVPNFARPPYDTREWFLTQLGGDGSWQQLDWVNEVSL